MTAPTPAEHATAAVDLLAQSDIQAEGGSVVAAQASVARAQVRALLAIAGQLAEANALMAPPEPDPEPEPEPEPPTEDPADAPLPD